MKRSSRVRLSAAVKRSLLPFSILSLALLLLGSPALATTPITVTIYQDMESGNAGDVLTASIMNASSHGHQGWSAYSGTLWVSTAYHRDLPGPVIAGGVTYNGTGGSRSWMFNNNLCMNCVRLSYGSFSEITEACYYTTGITRTSWTHGYDNIIAWGNSSFQCMQTLLNSNGSTGLILHCHSKTYLNIGTNHDPVSDSITYNKTYWVCMNYDGSVGQVTFMAFDPDNSYAQVGTTMNVVSTYNDIESNIDWGRGDNHGNDTYDPSQSYFDQILIDSTNAAFPLLPSGVNDTTAPSAPASVRDGTGQDQSIALSTTQLSANWDPAVDNESGIKGYQYAIGTTQGGTNIVNWTTVINVRGVTKTGLTLTTGQTYYFSVKAINGVGLTSSATNSNGQTVGTDTTAPSAPAAVRDGGILNYSPDIDETTSTNSLYCNWDPATDNESGISFYQYAYGTTPGGTDTLNWQTLPANWLNWSQGLGMNGLAASGTGGGAVTLTPGVRYYATVRAINNAGITGPAANSNGQICVNTSDTTPPSAPPAVRDGTGADISTTSSTTQLSANWDNSTDNESGISGYQYAIGTTAGGTNTVDWTSLDYVTTVTKTGLSLTSGQTYYFSVRAINGNNLTGSATNSNGQTVSSGTDTTPPSAPPAVRDGVGADISTTSSTTQLSANWDASTDNESGISGYQYAIGTTAGGTQTVNWTSLGNVTTVTKAGLTLSVGQTYYFSVKAVNGAGLTGSATNSNGQTVVSVSNVVYFQDNFENWTVHGGAWSSVNGESSTHTLNTSTDYAMAGSKSLKITDSDTTATTGASLTKNFSPVISGDIYVRFFVFLPTGYGSANSSCSRRILRVYTDTSNYTVITLTGDALSLSEVGDWGGIGPTAISENAWHCVELHVAPPSASTAIQYWIDGTSAGTCTGAFSGSSTFNYMQFGDVILATGTTNSTGTLYWDEVIVANYYIDPSAPSAPANVRDGTGADISTTSSTTQLSANWDAATDADSGISGYQYAIGTTAGGTQTVNWTSLGNVTTVTATGLTLTVGQTYYVSVRAVNGAGLNSAGTSSNGQTVVASAVTYFSDNFENWTVHGGAWSSVSGESSTQTLNTSTDYARAGTKSLKLTDSDTTASYGACLVKNFSPTISGDVYVRFYVFLPTGYASANPNAPRRVLRVNCQTNRGQMSFTADAPLMEEVGAWGAAQGSAVSENAWHCIEMHMATPSASTLMEFWVDGIKNSGTLNGSFSGSTSYDGIWLGDISTGSGTNGTGTYYLDELVVSNAYNGPLP